MDSVIHLHGAAAVHHKDQTRPDGIKVDQGLASYSLAVQLYVNNSVILEKPGGVQVCPLVPQTVEGRDAPPDPLLSLSVSYFSQ